MKAKSVKGTNDYLPAEAALRDYLQATVLSVYESSGYQRISTPTIEDIENLKKSDGGENLNLIFEIMKRGDKLKKALDRSAYEELSDLGLRYDLTLPLCRYCANNEAQLVFPMKCIQIDKVYRAERPQKGRLREFVQCDIDVLGTENRDAEVELICVTAKALKAIGIDKFKVRINDRQLLKSVLQNIGFKETELDSICIIFDKLDKIGVAGIEKELGEKEVNPDIIGKFTELLQALPLSLEEVAAWAGGEAAGLEQLGSIISDVKKLSGGTFDIVYDMSLVRGQGYYTGTIFEIESEEFHSSIAGGGRYDELVGKFLGRKVPAVGLSIGFERIFSILKEKQYEIPGKKKMIALFYEQADFIAAMEQADELRKEYNVSLFPMPKKLGKFLNKLENQNFEGFYVLGRDEEVKLFSGE